MSSTTEFEFDKNGGCQYTIGQELPEFAPMNYEAKFSFNKTSLDIIIGLALDEDEKSNRLNSDWLHVNLFFYRIIPSLVITTGYLQVAGNIVFKDHNKINIEDWLQSTDDYVNLVVVDDYHGYKVKEIRRVKLPLMAKVREVLKEQVSRCSGEIENDLEIVERGFLVPWMINYTDEQCNYTYETSDAIQKGKHIINEPKEKIAHVYY